MSPQPMAPIDLPCKVEPLKVAKVCTRFTEDDLVTREFLPHTSRQLLRKGRYCAA
jgi:hypothetical protein